MFSRSLFKQNTLWDFWGVCLRKYKEVCWSKTLSWIFVLFCLFMQSRLWYVWGTACGVLLKQNNLGIFKANRNAVFLEQCSSLNSSFFKKRNSSENSKTKSTGVCEVKYTMIRVRKHQRCQKEVVERGIMDYSVLSFTLQGSSTVSPSWAWTLTWWLGSGRQGSRRGQEFAHILTT